jgi:hypothetical protein
VDAAAANLPHVPPVSRGANVAGLVLAASGVRHVVDAAGAPVTCPLCADTFAITLNVRGITVCPSCGTSIVLADGKRAKFADTSILTSAELETLRKARKRPARPAPG